MSEKIIKNMSLGVIIYAISYMIATVIYCAPRILAEYSTINVSHITENFKFPIDIFSWGLLAICAGYSGADIGFGSKLKVKPNQGELKKDRVLQVIILLIIILFESTFFNLFIGHDFIVFSEYGKQTFPGIVLPLDGISTALVSTIVIYITGNQIVMNKEDDKNEKQEKHHDHVHENKEKDTE